jgi:hypothetical protein
MHANFGGFNPAQYANNPDQSLGRMGDRFANVAASIPGLIREGKEWEYKDSQRQADENYKNYTYDKATEFLTNVGLTNEEITAMVRAPYKGEDAKQYIHEVGTLLDNFANNPPPGVDAKIASALQKMTPTALSRDAIDNYHARNIMSGRDRFAPRQEAQPPAPGPQSQPTMIQPSSPADEATAGELESILGAAPRPQAESSTPMPAVGQAAPSAPTQQPAGGVSTMSPVPGAPPPTASTPVRAGKVGNVNYVDMGAMMKPEVRTKLQEYYDSAVRDTQAARAREERRQEQFDAMSARFAPGTPHYKTAQESLEKAENARIAAEEREKKAFDRLNPGLDKVADPPPPKVRGGDREKEEKSTLVPRYDAAKKAVDEAEAKLSTERRILEDKKKDLLKLQDQRRKGNKSRNLEEQIAKLTEETTGTLLKNVQSAADVVEGKRQALSAIQRQVQTFSGNNKEVAHLRDESREMFLSNAYDIGREAGKKEKKDWAEVPARMKQEKLEKRINDIATTHAMTPESKAEMARAYAAAVGLQWPPSSQTASAGTPQDGKGIPTPSISAAEAVNIATTQIKTGSADANVIATLMAKGVDEYRAKQLVLKLRGK